MRTTLGHRTTRKLKPTESGRLCLERAARILADGVGVEAEILEAAIPRGLVRMAATTAFGVEALAPLLPEFLATDPDIEIDFCLTEGKVDIVAKGLDCAVRIGGLADSSLRVSRLFSFRRPLVAASAFIERYGTRSHPSKLADLPAVRHWRKRWRASGNPRSSTPIQGSQFTGTEFTGILQREKITISMDGKPVLSEAEGGCWRDNIFVERLWRSVKYEEVYLHAYALVPEARSGIGRYFGFYNAVRPHLSLGCRTPDRYTPDASRSGVINGGRST